MIPRINFLLVFLLVILSFNLPESIFATPQLPEEARSRFDELVTLKLEAEKRALRIIGGLNGVQPEEVIINFRVCKNKYEVAKEAYDLIIDRLIFLANQGQDFSRKDISYTEKYARERRKEFWDCKFPGRHDTFNIIGIEIDGEGIKNTLDLIFKEIEKYKNDWERRNILKAYSDELGEIKWKNWEQLEKKSRFNL